MSRVETLLPAAARPQAPAQARAQSARSDSPSFALPELFSQVGARQTAQSSAKPVRSSLPESGRSAVSQKPRQQPDRANATPRSRQASRRENGRDADQTRNTDGKQAARSSNAETGTTRVVDKEKDDGATETAAAEEAEEAALQGGAAESGVPGLIMPTLALPAAAAAGEEPEAGSPDHPRSKASLAGVVGPKGADHAGATGLAALVEAAGQEEAAPSAEAKPGVVSPVVAGLAENVSAGGERSRSVETGADLLNQLKDATPEPSVAPKPAFAEMLEGAKAAESRAGATAQRAIATDVAVGRVPVEIGLRALEGSSRFEIRLSPEELGRVDVRLDIDDAGEVKAHLIVERPEALALLTRDRAQLERAFEQAGLKPAENGLAFSLRDETGSGTFAGQGGHGGDRPQRGSAPHAADEAGTARNPAAPLPRAILSRLGALDLTI